MKKTLIIPKKVITVNSKDEILTDYAVEITDGEITAIKPKSEYDLDNYFGAIFESSSLILAPGFIQTHVHLCQTLFRGLADDLELLDWLKKRIFPYENSHDSDSLKLSAQLGIYELQKSGTTTILDMGTINHQEIIFEELIDSRIRAFAGKCMIDQNPLFPKFVESKDKSLRSTEELAKKYHNSSDGRINYGFAPRFVLSCSEDLLKETMELSNDFEGSLYHTHSSENKDEIEAVKKLTGKDNIEYFNSAGLLNSKVVLAHCIHVSDIERKLLKEKDVRVSHCPSSNLKLGSGIANIPSYLMEGISVSLGADGPPCNNSLSMFAEMKLAALIQKPIHGPTSMDAKTVFKMATIEGAKALKIDDRVGSIEVGKRADLILLDLNHPGESLLTDDENIYSNLVYSTRESSITDVMIDGEWVVRNHISTIYDSEEIYSRGKQELKKLLKRCSV